MVISLKHIKSITWFLVVILLILAYPFQVYTKSPLPSLFPYVLMLAMVVSMSLLFLPSIRFNIGFRPYSTVFYTVCLYLLFIISHIITQVVLGTASNGQIFSEAVNYLLPAVFFFYFRKTARQNEIRALMYGIILASLICAVYFVYDSYMKLALGKVSDYAQLSFDYSLERSKLSIEEANMSRVRAGFRSFGLLESHSISGVWIVIGALATLTLVNPSAKRSRLLIIILFGMFLFISLNFSAIIAYFLIMSFFEFRFFVFFKGRIPNNLVKNMLIIVVVIILIFVIGIMIVGETMAETIFDLFTYQRNFLFGMNGPEQTQSTILANKFSVFFNNFVESPLAIMLGDITPNGKGGDVGVFDSIQTFGVIFYCFIIAGLIRLIISGIRFSIYSAAGSTISENISFNRSIVQFSVFILLLMIIMDFHYSVWLSKSVLPVIFFSLAMLERSFFLVRKVPLNAESSSKAIATGI